MSKNIRLLIALASLTTLVTVVALTVLPPRAQSPRLIAWLRASHNEKTYGKSHFYDKVEKLLNEGKTEKAREMIEKEKRKAKDSVEYYLCEAQDIKRHFIAMHTDSFLTNHRHLVNFLKSQKGNDDPRLNMLRLEENMQRSVYEMKMVGRMDTALVYLHRTLDQLSKMPGCTTYALSSLTNIADAYKFMGNYDKAIYYYRRAMEVGDSIGTNDVTLITIDIGIASAYTSMNSFEQSAEWWQRVEKWLPKMERAELFVFLNNRGNDYFLQENYEESLRYFLKLDSLVDQYPNMEWEKMFGRVNLSDVYIKLGRQEGALALINETEAFFTKEKQAIPLYYLTTQRIELALLNGHTAEARRLASESVTPEWVGPELMLLRQKVLLKLYKAEGNWQQYATTLKENTQLHDSLMSDNIRMQVSELVMRYDHERQMMEKQKQYEEMNLSFRWAVAYLIAAILVIILLVVISVYKRREEKLKQQNMLGRLASMRMETVRNRITPHFMGNALAAEMMAQMNGKDVDLDSLVQLLHRGIEMTGTEQITLAEELEFIEFYCHIESRIIGPDFAFRTQLADDVDPHQVRLPSMFLQIFVENSLKHGLKGRPRRPGKQRFVLIKATRQGEGTLIEVIDNGVGLPQERKGKANTGLTVVQETIALLNEQNTQKMSYTLENCQHPDGDRGCKASLYLPDNYKYVIT